ncbi:cytochrome P450 [Nocardiopsis sp. HNM0947]|uniref:Cytochrome P450 n=1 Tax=Nocardiopsis coralli TaxID=2772213 RepID=A0ABR9P475_9ACTN|nr:cytochrome P450 [Nocardiopsis coralli]MBE2998638.1 cytochrome P450 [Nocardiopsis coralli]
MSPQEHALPYPLTPESALEPPREWEGLRRECPVADVHLPNGAPAKLLTRHEDVKAMLADPRFERDIRVGSTAGDAGETGDDSADLSRMVPSTGENHLRWRRLVGRWFTAKRMRQLRPGMERIAEDLIRDMTASGQPADLKASLAFPLPVFVICDMLGVPAEDRERFSRWSDTLLNLTRYTGQEMQAAQREFVDYMAGHIEAKHAEPADDLISALIEQRESGEDGLDDTELLGTSMGLLIAGHETTANMIGKMVSMLLADRSRWERLVSDPSKVRTAVEESLRADANQGFGLTRMVTEDTEVAGETVPEGSAVVCSMAAANRDEHVFSDPDGMDLERVPNPHLAFGTGAHSCLGQALARTELQVTLEVLLRELPTLELASPPEHLERVEGLLVGGLREVPVRW